ncbi:AMP-dependent synthetase and ligase family protein [Prunus dulcis]|uniref:AMP-dependent synthetase and ligase family protein n=1 Tax=Prunus dulcis TaxID=3755 RepID=A0A4Y1R4F7_PRUDU|nr:AMP-dependent synthetase and ligase family protein [Prunus dulcis]
MRSTSPFKSLNQQLKSLCFYSPALRLKASSYFRRTNHFLCLSESRLFSSLQSGSFMEAVKVTNQGSATRDDVAIRYDQKSYSYNQLISSASSISSLLSNRHLNATSEASKHESPSAAIDCGRGQGHLGGARIGIVAKPSAEFVAGILGTWLSGGVAVPLALSYPEAELLHVMNDSDVSMILSTEDHQQLMENVAAKCAAQVSLIPPVPSSSSEKSADRNLQAGEIDADRIFHRNKKQSSDDPALIIYTSGTTGKPKGVVHTHKSISAQVEFMPKFSVRGIWQRWRESYPINGTKAADGITVFTGVPTMYTRLIQAHEAMDPELKAASACAARQLRLMMCGSSALPQPVMHKWESITGHRLLERYGMTEFVMAISNPLRGERKAGTVGKPFPGVEVRIVAEDDSGSDSIGVGELCIRSPSVFKEYWKLPEVTKESFTSDGFFRTGDAGTVDEDGYYIILGRTSADIMKVGGYKLSALEIESVLLQHPAVEECCVLGLPDENYGEIVCAIIVPEVEAKRKQKEELRPAISLEDLSAWAKDKLAPYKVNKKELKKTLASDS